MPQNLSGTPQPATGEKRQNQSQRQTGKHYEKYDRCCRLNAGHIQKWLDGARLKLAQRATGKRRTGIASSGKECQHRGGQQDRQNSQKTP
jgi:hypothetical protein